MNIFLDESGSFVSASKEDSWNSIVAYMVPEFDRRRLNDAVNGLKQAAGVTSKRELKLRDVEEADYFMFLRRLGRLHGAVFSVATDAGMNTDLELIHHRNNQVDRIVVHKEKMIHDSGRQALQLLSDQVRNLSPQLYVQLQCQILLISAVVRYGTLYFVQRYPRSLGRFRWRVDQKNSTRTEYEDAFRTMTPPMLQTISLKEPLEMLEGADYSAFSRFEYSEDEAPAYLEEQYGIENEGDAPGLNIGKLIHEDLQFVDSKGSLGVQAADLLAAGVRRLLRRNFNDHSQAARLLGTLMPQRQRGTPPVHLLRFSRNEQLASTSASDMVRLMQRYACPMLT